jgi:predicted secreted hydrolase
MRTLIVITGIVMLLAGAPAVGPADDFAQVTGPCALRFPADHGPHPEHRTEWWYYTGNLSTAGGRRFGFQLTFFRSRLKPPADRARWPQPASAWRSDQIYLAHAAVTDVAGGRHLQAEKMARPVLGMAGATQSDGAWKIHLNTWQTVISPERHHLRAAAGDFALTLDLTPDKPPVLHGEVGYSRKGSAREQASCYYSFTRLGAEGTVAVDGVAHPVRGSAWMDHEFSTAPLAPGITGWDWFSLQLSDDSELMVFLLRLPDGTLHPASSGTYVPASGPPRHLARDELDITPRAFWTSPHSGGRYPIQWAVVIEALQLELLLDASLADQEMRTPRSTNVVYWEGSVRAQGTRREKAVEGVGYVELTGYAQPFEAPM